jgi:hypothetical protein
MRRVEHFFGCLCWFLPAILGTAPMADAQPLWRIAEAPSTTIPDARSSGGGFSRVRGAGITGTGETVVADPIEVQVVLADRSGRVVRSLARRGQGPGELGAIAWMAVADDTVFVSDGLGRQLHVFLASSGFVERRAILAPGAGPLAVRCRLRNGSLVVAQDRTVPFPTRAGTFRDSTRLGILRLGTGQPVTWIGAFPGTTRLYHDAGAKPETRSATYTYGPQLHVACTGDLVWVGDSETGAVEGFTPTGAAQGRIQLGGLRRQFDERAIAAVLARDLQASLDADERGFHAAFHDRRWRAEQTPAFARLVPGSDGQLWVEAFREDTQTGARFVVYTNSDRPVAVVDGPGAVRFLAAQQGTVIGIVRDEDGFERVVIHQVSRR